ncbi:MAG: arginine repressor [Clostridiales bacterium]|nr:arginine repressor [Clostridiales bacterium]
MKNRRQMMIQSIIDRTQIETQEELANELRKRGLTVTQATISRDINELRLVKIAGEDGRHYYAPSRQPSQPIGDRLLRIFVDSVLSISAAGNLIVIKTTSGAANGAAEAVDTLEWPEILGTIAGDNTILIVLTDSKAALDTVAKFEEFLK